MSAEVNQGELITHWLAGGRKGAATSLKSDGDALLSYGWYPIAQKRSREVWLRRRKYSTATGKQIGKVRTILEASGYAYLREDVDDEGERWLVFRRR